MNIDKFLSRLALTLIFAEIFLILLSWLLSAAGVVEVRALISSEALRWFFSNFASFIGSPILVYMLLIAMTLGSLRQSKIIDFSETTERRTQGLAVAFTLLLLYATFIIVLIAIPHAPLLSTTGNLWPSPFSRAVIPIICFGIILTSSVYAYVSNRISSFSGICQSLSSGIVMLAPFMLVYILSVQLYYSLCYVFI